MSNNNIFSFQVKPVSTLWAPRKGVSASWRVSTESGQVLEFRQRLKETETETDQEIDDQAETGEVDQDLVREIELEVERLTEAEDQAFEENVDSVYGYMVGEVDQDEILNNINRSWSWDGRSWVEIEGETAKILGKTWKDRLVGLLVNHSTAETAGFRCLSNEIFSIPLGELEHEIPIDQGSDLSDLLGRANKETLKIFDGIVSGEYLLVSSTPAARISWRIDLSAFLDELESLGVSLETEEAV